MVGNAVHVGRIAIGEIEDDAPFEAHRSKAAGAAFKDTWTLRDVDYERNRVALEAREGGG